MNKKTLFIIGLIIVIATMSFLWFNRTTLYNKGDQPLNKNKQPEKQIATGTQPGQKAPDFNLVTLNDKKAKLSDYYGQKIFLNFWATWCPPCRAEMPAIQKLNENKNNVKVLTVNIGEAKGKVLNYLMENGFNFSVLLDENEETAREYNIRGIPTTFILDKNGIIEKRHSGGLTYEQMISLIEANQN